MEFSQFFGGVNKKRNNFNNDKKKNDNIDRKFMERKKRNIQIDKNLLKNLKIDNSFVENAIKKINEYRKLHGVEPLIQDDYLIKRAFILSKKKLTNYFSEDFLYKDGDDLGCNFEKCEDDIKAEKLIEKWYQENKSYNFIEPIELECNNFTQMIWKNTKRFGIGYYHEKEKNKIYCVALFHPAGNIPGEYKKNVLKKRKEISDLENPKKIQEKSANEIGGKLSEIFSIKIIITLLSMIIIIYVLRKLYIEHIFD